MGQRCEFKDLDGTYVCKYQQYLVLCSAPSVSKSVFTITEKAPTRAY